MAPEHHHFDHAVPLADDPRDTAHTATYTSNLPLKVLLAGTSNCLSALATGPPDLIKVRQQLESQSGRSSSFAQIIRRMYVAEGPFSYWKGKCLDVCLTTGPSGAGASAAMLREASYSGIRMGGYDTLKAQFPVSMQSTYLAKLASGLVSGMTGAAIANPADLLKVRMQAPGNTMRLRDHIAEVYKTGGIGGFYRAVVPTILRAGLLTSFQLGTYDHAKHTLIDAFPGTFDENFQTHFLSSGIAGLVCSIVTAPVDTIKVRVMNDTRYSSAVDCTMQIIKNEGPLALYKGLFACWIRLWPHTVISLMIYEKLRSVAGLAPV